MELTVVKDIMTERVISIDIDSKISDARKLMRDNDLRKIVVTKQGKPEYIMIDWKTLKADGDKTINEIEKKLHRANTVSQDEDVDNIKRDLEREPALIVMGYNKQMVGVVSASDLFKGMSKSKYVKAWRS